MSKAIGIVRAVAVATLVACLTGGCMGGLSLLSSSHTHYEGKPGMEERIGALEQRVQKLEQPVPAMEASHDE
jgi:hypothetical protein